MNKLSEVYNIITEVPKAFYIDHPECKECLVNAMCIEVSYHGYNDKRNIIVRVTRKKPCSGIHAEEGFSCPMSGAYVLEYKIDKLDCIIGSGLSR